MRIIISAVLDVSCEWVFGCGTAAAILYRKQAFLMCRVQGGDYDKVTDVHIFRMEGAIAF